jgi:iduronate 2-sulfatase
VFGPTSLWDKWFDSTEPRDAEYHSQKTVDPISRMKIVARKGGLKGKGYRSATKGPAIESNDSPDSEYFDGYLTAFAIEQLKAKSDKPFFITLGYRKPHLPFVAPKKYWDLYERENIALPDNYFLPENSPKIAHSTWGELRSYPNMPAKGPLDDKKAKELIHGYYACVSFVDTQIGRVLATLKSEGLDKNTVVILWSDHGWKLGEHAMWAKHTNYEIDTRVPLIMRFPTNENGGSSTKRLVELIDLFPTVCELANVATPEQCEGKSLLPIIQNPNVEIKNEFALSQYKRKRKKGGDIIGYSVRNSTGRFTDWINRETGKSHFREYYDHQTDPNENLNAIDRLSSGEIEAYSRLIENALKKSTK